MPRIIPIVALWFIIQMTTVPAWIQAAESAPLETTITLLEQSMGAAYAANDGDRYFALFAPDMTGVFYDQNVSLAAYRQSWNEAFASGRRIRYFKPGEITVRPLPGRTAAIALFSVDVTIDHPDGDISTEHAFQTDVWVKRKGGWQLLHAHFAVATPAAH
jgi:ketosteroid isomerase-like protein